jgi:dienelactone hydrolase
MHSRPRRIAILIALALLAWVPGAHATITQLPGLLREPLTLHVTLPDGSHAELEALLTRPDKPGRFPLAMINHGMARDADAIVHGAPENYSSPAIEFAMHGYAAVVVNRRGFGLSSGAVDLGAVSCSDRDYTKTGDAEAVDVQAALKQLRSEPWAEPDSVLLVGHSAGGSAALALAATQSPEGVVALIIFAGGLGSIRPDFVCQPERLVTTMKSYGLSTHLPSLWIYAQNDHFFGPALARQMFDAYAAGGAPAQFEAAPPFAADGHSLIFSPPPSLWWPRVAAFLAPLHLPTEPVTDLPPLPTLPDPPNLDARGKADFASYLRTWSFEKAFATDDKGHYGRIIAQRTQEDAEAAALKHCRDRGWDCRIYAVGNTLKP